MNFTRIEQEDDGLYSVYFSDLFYDYFSPYYNHLGSYFNIFYRLFDLLPQDFYHMVGSNYNAIFKPNPALQQQIYMRFKKTDAEKFCNEINSRIQYCINLGDFN